MLQIVTICRRVPISKDLAIQLKYESMWLVENVGRWRAINKKNNFTLIKIIFDYMYLQESKYVKYFNSITCESKTT